MSRNFYQVKNCKTSNSNFSHRNSRILASKLKLSELSSTFEFRFVLKKKPDEYCGFFLLLQTTGTTLSARARAQINIAVLRNEDFSGLHELNNTIVPLLWFDEGLDELSDDLRNEIAKAVEDPPIYKGSTVPCLFSLEGLFY